MKYKPYVIKFEVTIDDFKTVYNRMPTNKEEYDSFCRNVGYIFESEVINSIGWDYIINSAIKWKRE